MLTSKTTASNAQVATGEQRTGSQSNSTGTPSSAGIYFHAASGEADRRLHELVHLQVI